jgi:hypothetical protein
LIDNSLSFSIGTLDRGFHGREVLGKGMLGRGGERVGGERVGDERVGGGEKEKPVGGDVVGWRW